jgi:hypothetical protein
LLLLGALLGAGLDAVSKSEGSKSAYQSSISSFSNKVVVVLVKAEVATRGATVNPLAVCASNRARARESLMVKMIIL